VPGPCYGVSWDSSNRTCLALQNKTDQATVNSTLVVVDGLDSALANATQLEPPDTTCPYTTLTVQTSSSGLQFEIFCNKDFSGFGDYCPWNYPACSMHADTMTECMDLCAGAHGYCRGFSWNPDMIHGYGNCYLKTNVSDGGANSTEGRGYVTHSATVSQSIAINATCPSNKTYQASDGSVFDVTCSDKRSNVQNLTSYYFSNVEACMENCSLVTGTGASACLGVLFDNVFDDGYDNCILLNDTGSSDLGANVTFAARNMTTVQSLSHPSASKAWIAGPVVGGVCALLAVAGFFWWLQRRRVSKRGKGSAEVEKQHLGPNHLAADGKAASNPQSEEGGHELSGQECLPMLPSDKQRYELPPQVDPQELGTER
jgi:hypothetical protein